jgi:small subunit ribosomal protein S1
MVDELILQDMNVLREEIDREVEEAMASADAKSLEQAIDESIKDFEPGSIVTGRVINIIADDVIVDVGYKSEGLVALNEFDPGEDVKPGMLIEVLLDAVEDDAGIIVLSKRKADRIRGWEKVIKDHKEGDVVTGRVMRKIKGGLLVDIGVPVFLPASQVNIRRPGDIAEYIGKEVTCKILKIDESRRNIVVSRRKLIEEERDRMKSKLMETIEVGQTRKGVVKNIADFGAFVDLGGIDGLLHITDMSWSRVSHPSEVVAIDEEIEVVILNVDKERERIALGLKQKTQNPWSRVPEKYPVQTRHKGEVVNIVNYGAFVKLEDGVEGLVHISEMSWTRRINHPSEIVAIGDIVEVVVLGINEDKQEISLGMKQTESNPWARVEEKYPAGTVIKGRVRNLTNYGAFIELEEGIDGLLHVSDMSWTKKINHPSELLKKGDKIEAVVLNVSEDKKRVALGLKQLEHDPWQTDIPKKYAPGQMVRGKVTKLTSFGAFVEMETELEGLLHISEMSSEKVEKPEDVVKVGDEVEVMILRVDSENRKIGLSMRPDAKPEEESPAEKPESKPEPVDEGPDTSPKTLTSTVLDLKEHAAAEPAEEAPNEEAPEEAAGSVEEAPEEASESTEEAPKEEAPEEAAGSVEEAPEEASESAEEAPNEGTPEAESELDEKLEG